ncbi:TonB-dependent receptor [uncultured Winogradskyella sp.]|uniref:TonB-dependent receptor n=1 Tax=uncultured Winogradskyella sp. TaxID=395353 RepID=UPI0030DC2491
MASLIGVPFFACAQFYEVQGSISDSLGKPVNNAIVIASQSLNESDIIAYKTSNSKGHFMLRINKSLELDSINLTIRHMAYKTIKLQLPLTNITKALKLYPKIELLESVLLKSQKTIELKGDTITYNVKRIKSKKDYTIEEAINRIPGVTISESGQIKYEGKAISHLYINGVDLLEGRYSIATQGIPADAVKEIDIMKKHNHQRIDRGRTESNAVAFNLKIKEDLSLVFGSIKGEAGTPVITGLTEGTPIYLKDKFQNISSFKSNNIGKTLKDVGNSFTTGDLNIYSLKMQETPVIRPPNINGVILSNKFWLNNDSYSLTNDALHKISDSTLLKWNINYINELSQIENRSSTTFIINNDSSIVLNSSRNQLRGQRFRAGVNQEINKRNFYLKNNTVFRYNDNLGKEDIILNENPILTNYQNFNTYVNNSTLIKTLIDDDNILQSGLIVEYEQQSEQLKVAPPVFNNNIMNIKTLQEININKFNISGFSEYVFEWLNLRWNTHQKIQLNSFNFKSSLQQMPEFEEEDFPFSSDFNFREISSTTKINSKLNLGKMRLSWRLSADLISLNTKETSVENIEQDKFFFLMQPFLSAQYKISTKFNLGVSYNQNNNISDFSELYQAVVLTNYNSLVQNPNIINKSKSETITPFLNYSNILKSFFLKLNGKWNRSKSNITFVNQLSEQGFFTTEVVERPNSVNNYGISLNLTKGFLGSFSTDLSYAFSYAENELFFNNQFLNAINRRHSLDFGFSWDKGNWYSIEYEGKLNFGTSELPNNKIENSFLFQTVNLDFYTSSSTRIHFGLESSKTSTSTNNNINRNALFNVSFYYKPSKKLYFKASVLNIFDTKFFSTTVNGVNFVNVSQFSLRPRQFSLGLTYSL